MWGQRRREERHRAYWVQVGSKHTHRGATRGPCKPALEETELLPGSPALLLFTVCLLVYREWQEGDRAAVVLEPQRADRGANLEQQAGHSRPRAGNGAPLGPPHRTLGAACMGTLPTLALALRLTPRDKFWTSAVSGSFPAQGGVPDSPLAGLSPASAKGRRMEPEV